MQARSNWFGIVVSACAALSSCSEPADATQSGGCGGDTCTSDAVDDGADAEGLRACVSKSPTHDEQCTGNVGELLLSVQCGQCACTHCVDACCVEVVCDDGFGECAPKPDAGGEDVADSCTSHDDCSSAVCVQDEVGGHCGVLCMDACPDPGATCQGVKLEDADPIFACLPEHLSLCRPCAVDGDCVMISGATAPHDGATCLTLPSGRFCGRACDEVHPCPSGFSCNSGDDGGTAQCTPDSGDCSLPGDPAKSQTERDDGMSRGSDGDRGTQGSP
jgi:hypothetical protein